MLGPEIKRRLGALDALIFSAFHHEAINTRLSLELNPIRTKGWGGESPPPPSKLFDNFSYDLIALKS